MWATEMLFGIMGWWYKEGFSQICFNELEFVSIALKMFSFSYLQVLVTKQLIKVVYFRNALLYCLYWANIGLRFLSPSEWFYNSHALIPLYDDTDYIISIDMANIWRELSDTPACQHFCIRFSSAKNSLRISPRFLLSFTNLVPLWPITVPSMSREESGTFLHGLLLLAVLGNWVTF